MNAKLVDLYPNAPTEVQNIILKNITADSRKVQQGDIFVAIKGTKINGYDYIPSTINQGAILIIGEMLPETPLSIPFYQVSDARKALTDILSVIYPNRPQNLYAVTGTNGKTSVADFIRQILDKQLKRQSVSIGTLGLIASSTIPSNIIDGIPFKIEHTTPDPEVLYPTLDYLARNNITDCVIEASSHGLSQGRFGALKFDCVLFTNLSHDHLDYHKTIDAYFNAKMLLFTNHIHPKTQVIIFDNDDISKKAIDVAKQQTKYITCLTTHKDNKMNYLINDFTPHAKGSSFSLISKNNKSTHLETHFVGQFQTYNVIMALLAVKSINKIQINQKILNMLETVDGRLDFIAETNNIHFYVDYAHTPDALEKALQALKPHCIKNLICVFGCGGNRDTQKRPIMGQVAADNANIVIVTDDNPRFEDADNIRSEIIKGIKKSSKAQIIDIPDRKQAIIHALKLAKPHDIVLVAGKGHETGQIICDKTLPFKDAEVIRDVITNTLHLNQPAEKIIENKKMDSNLLWTQTGICAVTGGSVIKPFNITGVAIDSRDVKPGDLFIALKAHRDGHYFIKNAAQNGATAALVAWKPRGLPKGFPVVYVKNTLHALEKLATAARNRVTGKIIAITGTAGKTTSKEILLSILSKQGNTHASIKSFNNHIGVPLSLSRMPVDTQYGIFELGMNHAGEIKKLVNLVKPNVAIITTVGNGHREAFNSVEDIAHAKAEITDGIVEGGTVILNQDIDTFEILQKTAQERNLNIVTFGTNEQANIRLSHYDYDTEKQLSSFTITVHDKQYPVSTPLQGAYNALNICAIIAALDIVKADIPKAIETLKEITPASGRGEKLTLALPDKGTITLIDESYNANPLSMQAALNNMVNIKPVNDGKKIAVLGSMYELGAITEQAHIDLKDAVIAGAYDTIYLVGKEMSALYDALGEDQPAVLAEELSDISDEIIQEATEGSVVVIKGSNSVKLWQLVTSFKKLANVNNDTVSPIETTDSEESDIDN